MWSCGTEGRLLFENLCQHPSGASTARNSAPREHARIGPRDTAHVIVYNYFLSRVCMKTSLQTRVSNNTGRT